MQSILEYKKESEISTDKKDINTETPSVTIGIPVLNEEDHIERVISGFLDSDYPNLIEILIADGGSTDRTQDIVCALSERDSRVKLIDNPERFQSFALNKMIGHAKGRVFLRADAHCDYGEDFIQKCVENLQRENVKNSGGAARFLAYNDIQAGTAMAVLSTIGNGGARHYNPGYEGFSDTVPMGCFWLEDLKKLNGFTESNHTNEDAEINYRIQNELKGKIFISPEIKLWYYPRKTFFQLLKQYFRYGRGRCLTSFMHKGKIPFRSKAPFLFLSLLVIYLITDFLFSSISLGSIYIVGWGLAFLIFEAIRTSFGKREYFLSEIWRNKTKKAPGRITLSFFIFIVFIGMLFGHFLGYGYQRAKIIFLNKVRW